MSKLEQAKARLKEAVTKLEDAIQKKLLKLELENNTLKAEMAKLLKQESKSKQEGETPAPSSRKKNKDDKTLDLINAKTSNEIDLSLNELKKLVR